VETRSFGRFVSASALKKGLPLLCLQRVCSGRRRDLVLSYFREREGKRRKTASVIKKAEKDPISSVARVKRETVIVKSTTEESGSR